MAEGTRDDLRPLPRFPAIAIVATTGALWGAAGYAVLWGLTPFTVSRRFVLSSFGTIALLPVRLVLGSIRLAERVLDRTFFFADSNWWIGAIAAALGAGIATSAYLLGRYAIRRARAARV